MPLRDGEQFAEFKIVRLLGSGGMGEVYLAQHPRLPRQEALKVLPSALSSDSEYRERFSREADIASTLYHPHIVGVHDRGESDGRLWISMDFINGTDAAEVLRHAPGGLPPLEVAEIATAIADALDYAHDHGLLHRDVKPANILLSRPPSGRQRILLADFGISRWLDDTNGLTKTNTTLGTVLYSAPEQLTGGAMDGRTDQYALAATVYHLLTGAPPYDNSNPAAVIGQHLSAPIPPLAQRDPSLARFDSVLRTALAKEPGQRFARCSDFAAAFSAHATASRPVPVDAARTMAASTRPAPVFEAPQPHPPIHAPAASASAVGSRWRWPLTIGVVALAMIVAGLVFTAHPWRQDATVSAAEPARTRAEVPPAPRVPDSPAAPTFEDMRAFILDYYAELPANASTAWAKLDVGYQQRTGLSDYLQFWSTIRSVSVVTIAPRDGSSVVTHMEYVQTDGKVFSDDRWFRVVSVDGKLLISDSELL
jgi:serine/threonine protein kinase, bacterial